MDLKMVRHDRRPDGIFSSILKDGIIVFETVSHAYMMDHEWRPKVPPGTYTCKRGPHRLKGGPEFETFEITGVEGHSGILFHVGNYDENSEGCECIGLQMVMQPRWMVTSSKIAFEQFLKMQEGVAEFQLVVEDAT